MKKTNSIFKTIVAIAILLVMAQGCVPAGGNTPTSGIFNVNLCRTNLMSSSLFCIQKVILVDGDSLGFLISDKGCSLVGFFSHLLVYYKQSATNNYEFLCAEGNGIYSDQPQKGIAFLPANQNINNNTDTIYLNDNTSMFNNNGNKIYWSQSIGLAQQGCVSLNNQLANNYTGNPDPMSLNRFSHVFGLSRSDFGFNPTDGFRVMTMVFPAIDYYIVFRKFKTTGYQYYWVRCKTEQNSINGEFTFCILNGKFQQNSITTGL